MCLCLQKRFAQRRDEDGLLRVVGQKKGEGVWPGSLPVDREVFGLVFWEHEMIKDVFDSEPLKFRKSVKMARCSLFELKSRVSTTRSESLRC